MTDLLHIPGDELTGKLKNYNLIADWLELSAFFADISIIQISEVANALSVGDDDSVSLHEEMEDGEDSVVSTVTEVIKERQNILGSAYPFALDRHGDFLHCILQDQEAHTAYLLSLVLSNLSSVSPVLAASRLHPEEEETRRLRRYFQRFATVGLAGEVQGRAWSFGFPRPDGSGFLQKLAEIWAVLGDGIVERQEGAPEQTEGR